MTSFYFLFPTWNKTMHENFVLFLKLRLDFEDTISILTFIVIWSPSGTKENCNIILMFNLFSFTTFVYFYDLRIDTLIHDLPTTDNFILRYTYRKYVNKNFIMNINGMDNRYLIWINHFESNFSILISWVYAICV